MKRRVKTVIFLIGAAATLFALNSFYLSIHNPLLDTVSQDINTQKVSSQKLFDKNWQTIKNEYYDPNFNHQHWNRWRNHHQGF